MEKEVTTKVESNNSLMRKTKAQLVDIILRKDDVEKELKKALKEKDEHNSALSALYKNNCKDYDNLLYKVDLLKEKYDKLEYDYHKTCDDNVVEVQIFKNKLNKRKLQMFCLAIYGVAVTILYLFY